MPSSSDSSFSIQHPLKSWKNLLSPPFKPSNLSPNIMKPFSAICIFSVLSLYFFSAFPIAKWRFSCAGCNHTLTHASYQSLINGEEIQKTNISHILFGISGSAKTWSRRRHYCELWWKPNVTRGFIWLDEEPSKDGEPWPETSPPYKVSANTARFKYSCRYGKRSAVRIARIVKESFELGLENVRWFVMGDDDTVFLPENLVTVLNKYDYKQMYYIGGNSESVAQDVVHSYSMAYGGGGFAISRPLAQELVRILDGCIDRYAAFYGSDHKIGGCISEIGVPLTKELGFHQLDIRGSPYGLLSAHPLAPLVSLHHLDYVHPLFSDSNRVASVKTILNAYKFDPTRILQHTFCYDLTRNWSISVSWGYTVQLYPSLVKAQDLSTPLQTFLTWAWNKGPFTFDTRAMSLDPCERPIEYFFNGVEEVNGGEGTLTRYRKRNDSVQWGKCKKKNYAAAHLVKGFNISAGLVDPKIWYEARRRECCQIIKTSGQQDGIVQVIVRGCNKWESVTPP